MIPNIHTLTDDIDSALAHVASGGAIHIPDDVAAQFGETIGQAVVKALTGRERTSRVGTKTLYASEIGSPCPRKVWYGYYHPELADPLEPHAIVKFLYGDIVESVTLLLAKVAGHDVTDEQAPVEFQYRGWTVRGRIDCKIDGELVDVKSASGFAVRKFEEGLNDSNDAFGYRAQLGAYSVGMDAVDKPLRFLVMNKETGRLGTYETEQISIAPVLDRLIEALEIGDTPPERAFSDEPNDTQGNRKIPTACSYCAYKRECWKDANGGAGLRKFIYSKGPVWMTEVKSQPKVIEVPA